MFTGIIENLGKVTVINKPKNKKDSALLVIQTESRWIDEIKIGESIAVNGCCLTVVRMTKNELTFDLSDETWRKTAFSFLKVGSTVNLERALSAQGRFGGHFLLGHVDCVGRVSEVKKTKGSIVITIRYPKENRKLLIDKGSVAIEGVSLTACDVKKNKFVVYIIPHTWENTTLKNIESGDWINLEFDVLGKYVLNAIKK